MLVAEVRKGEEFCGSLYGSGVVPPIRNPLSNFPAFRHTLMTGQIGVRAYVIEPGAHKEVAYVGCLLPPMFEDQPTART